MTRQETLRMIRRFVRKKGGERFMGFLLKETLRVIRAYSGPVSIRKSVNLVRRDHEHLFTITETMKKRHAQYQQKRELSDLQARVIDRINNTIKKDTNELPERPELHATTPSGRNPDGAAGTRTTPSEHG